jgi:hypothetical protein
MEQSYHRPIAAIPMLLGMVPSNFTAQFASQCSWEGITKVTLKVITLYAFLGVLTCHYI